MEHIGGRAACGTPCGYARGVYLFETMGRFVERVQQGEFDRFVSARRIVIIRIQTGEESYFDHRIADYFDAEYGYEAQFGWFNIGKILAYEHWAQNHLKEFSNKRNGYLLTIQGKHKAFHDIMGTQGRANNNRYSAILRHQSLEDRFLEIFDKETVQKTIVQFDNVIRGKTDSKLSDASQPNAKKFDTEKRSTQSSTARTPYEILGLTIGAGTDEIERAKKDLLAKNHPDKLTHMDPAIQQYGAERTKEILAAYSQLMHIQGKKQAHS